jgi:hypothetical protein
MKALRCVGISLCLGLAAHPAAAMTYTTNASEMPMVSMGLSPLQAHTLPADGAKTKLGHWKNTMARQIFPRFYFSLDGQGSNHSEEREFAPAIPVFVDADNHFEWALDSKTRFTFDQSDGLFEPSLFHSGSLSETALGFSTNQLIQQELVVPGFSHRVSDHSSMSVSAVFAFQSYADLSLGSLLQPDQDALEYISPAIETSRGVGVRLGFAQQLGKRIEVRSHFQSRINMDEFGRVHGVYSEPGDFDVPAVASIDIAVATPTGGTFNLKSEQTFYSNINAFPTKALPERFLSLLQDGTSPEFAWRDLTVYSIGFEQPLGKNTRARLELTSRQQPEPTSDILALVLDQASADRNLRLTVNTRLYGGQLKFYASYAPKPLVFGRTELGQVNRSLGKHSEGVVIWTRSF